MYEAIKNLTLDAAIVDISSAILGLVGVISVLFLIIGGVRYITAAGSAEQVQAAKQTILYAVIGLVIAILSYAVVKYILGAFLIPPQ